MFSVDIFFFSKGLLQLFFEKHHISVISNALQTVPKNILRFIKRPYRFSASEKNLPSLLKIKMHQLPTDNSRLVDRTLCPNLLRVNIWDIRSEITAVKQKAITGQINLPELY